jgi:glutathione synthase/RimK-type ligase-like ATP-grasp enzyme
MLSDAHYLLLNVYYMAVKHCRTNTSFESSGHSVIAPPQSMHFEWDKLFLNRNEYLMQRKWIFVCESGTVELEAGNRDMYLLWAAGLFLDG